MTTERWHLRHDNFRRALALLQEAVAAQKIGRLSDLEREGLIQRFEYTWELGWKSLRDFLFATGIEMTSAVPANVIRAAFQAGLIEDGEAWMEARTARNRMAHEYNRAAFEAIVVAIANRYLPLLEALELRLADERRAGN